MYILLLCSLFVVYIGMERAILYSHGRRSRLCPEFYTYMKLGQYDKARELAEESRGGLAISCAMCSPAVPDGMCALI